MVQYVWEHLIRYLTDSSFCILKVLQILAIKKYMYLALFNRACPKPIWLGNIFPLDVHLVHVGSAFFRLGFEKHWANSCAHRADGEPVLQTGPQSVAATGPEFRQCRFCRRPHSLPCPTSQAMLSCRDLCPPPAPQERMTSPIGAATQPSE